MVETGKPSLATRIAYGVGGAAGGIKNNGFEYVLLLFYSQIMGLSAVLVAAALWIALLIDAFSGTLPSQVVRALHVGFLGLVAGGEEELGGEFYYEDGSVADW